MELASDKTQTSCFFFQNASLQRVVPGLPVPGGPLQGPLTGISLDNAESLAKNALACQCPHPSLFIGGPYLRMWAGGRGSMR